MCRVIHRALPAQVSETISLFVATAEAAVRDVAPESIAVSTVSQLARDAFVAGVAGTPAIREHIKLHVLPPAPLEQDDAEAQARQAVCACVSVCALVEQAPNTPVTPVHVYVYVEGLAQQERMHETAAAVPLILWV